MKKRIFSLFMAMGMLLSLLPVPAGAATVGGTCGESLTWSLSGSTLTISGTGEMEDYEFDYDYDPDEEKPTNYRSQAPWAAYADEITSVVIKDGVSSLGDGAFCGCENLRSVTIPASVSHIDEEVFGGCEALQSVYITDIAVWCGIVFGPNGNPLGQGANLYLNDVLVTDLIIPEGVSEIADYAFLGCGSITSVTIPASVTDIGLGAFYDCADLRDIRIGDMAAWCAIYFRGDPWTEMDLYLNGTLVTDLTIPDGVSEIGDSAFQNCKSLRSVTFPENVGLGWDSFSGCSNLTSITFADGVSLGWSAFNDCDSLENVWIPAGMTEFTENAFDGCDNLKGIWVDEDNPNYASDSRGVLFNKDFTELLAAPGGLSGAYEIPGTITELNGVFDGCGKLTSLTIPASVEWIDGFGLFSGCSSLQGIWVDANNPNYASDARGVLFNKDMTTLLRAPEKLSGDYAVPEGTAYIYVYAFDHCTDLRSVTIPEGVWCIDGCAFLNCSSLQRVTIPSTLTFMNSYAFEGCDSLARVDISDITAWCNMDKNYNPLETGAELYLNGQMPTELTIPGDVERIGGKDFYSCDALESVTITADLEWIANRAFEGCGNLKTVKFEGNAPAEIVEDAFLEVTATVWYPCGNETWTEDVMLDYGGNLTWKPRHHYVDGVCEDCGEELDAAPGDYTGDGVITNEDVAYLLWHTLFPGDYPVDGDADFTGDGAVSNEDVCHLLWHTLFPEDYPINK